MSTESDVDARHARFLERLTSWNQRINLVAAGDIPSLATRHLQDSLALSALLPGPCQQIVDLGSGGGFPGVPLAIRHPEREFTLLDRRTKAVAFLRAVRRELGLENVRVLHQTIGAFRPDPPPELVVSRAAFPPIVLLSHAARILPSGGHVIVMYGLGNDIERPDAFEVIEAQTRPEGRANVLYKKN
jgi:16S rRNA (guanine527-N7)-methyltransferase